jgi:hypothetical protein
VSVVKGGFWTKWKLFVLTASFREIGTSGRTYKSIQEE